MIQYRVKVVNHMIYFQLIFLEFLLVYCNYNLQVKQYYIMVIKKNSTYHYFECNCYFNFKKYSYYYLIIIINLNKVNNYLIHNPLIQNFQVINDQFLCLYILNNYQYLNLIKSITIQIKDFKKTILQLFNQIIHDLNYD